MPDECSVVHISPLLRELLITAVDIPLDRPPEERHEYIMKLILEEIRTLPTLPLYLPIPEGSVIAPVCRDIIDFPGAPPPLETCAQRTGRSAKPESSLVCRGLPAANRCSRSPSISVTRTPALLRRCSGAPWASRRAPIFPKRICKPNNCHDASSFVRVIPRRFV